MMLGLSLSAFTMLHVIISLVGIVSGILVLFGLLGSRRMPGWTALFLLTTILTSLTGFGFPFTGLLPSHMVGILSLVLLAIACIALYGMKLSGAWRWIYVVTAIVSLYFNVFVLVIQSFIKVALLNPLAPTQTNEPAFVIAQLLVALYLNIFVLIIQGFLKIPALTVLAPGNPPSGPAFAVVQGLVLLFFVIVIIGAARRFRPV
jgi:hypothetical protein